MKNALLLSVMVGTAAIAITAASPAYATGECPAVGSDTDCGFLITINPNGSITAGPTGRGPYDGVEDTLVGIRNNASSALTSLFLSGANIFGFDGDGEAAFTGTSYGSTGYEGPNTAFSIVDFNNGTVNFLKGGVAGGGGTAWFTLEENPSDGPRWRNREERGARTIDMGHDAVRFWGGWICSESQAQGPGIRLTTEIH